MKLAAFLMACGLLLSGNTQANNYNGPTPNVTDTREYEIPSGAPADVYLWDNDYGGATGYSPTYSTYTCVYSSLQQTCTHQSNGSTITIILTEKRSGMTHPLKLQANSKALYIDSADPSQAIYCGSPKALNSYEGWNCYDGAGHSILTNTKALTVWIPTSEMNNLPVGGVWEGKLKIRWEAGSDSFDYTANITLKGKATGKQDIYFPEFNGANPLVQLDLHPTGSVTGNSFAEDVTTLDMCLYDGYNSNSDSMTLSFSDEGRAGAGRNEGDFSIYNTATGGTAAAERIDYHLEMFDPHSKSWMAVKNNNSFVLSAGVNGQDQIRPVRLPSISYPVLCAPTPLRLIVDKFRVTEKAAGYYKGTLHVEFSPSLNSI